jgi:hypothetical protein
MYSMNFIRLGGESESALGLCIVVLVVPGFVFSMSVTGGEWKVASFCPEGMIFPILLVHL